MVATVPDLIAVLDAQNGSALGTPQYKYGLRVLVLGITAAPQWTGTERGIALGGPSAFGCVSWRVLMESFVIIETMCTDSHTYHTSHLASTHSLAL